MPVDGVKSGVGPVDPVSPVSPVSERRARDEEGARQGPPNDEFKRILKKECLKKDDAKKVKDNPPAAQVELPLVVVPSHVNAEKLSSFCR